MQCVSPLVIKKKDGMRAEVPCGTCIGCKISRAREWAVRCLHEASLWKYSSFITLTYRNEDMPANGSLDITEFTKFWKRLRKLVDPEKLRYYGCGEYGEETGRPHYHAIVFGLKPCGCPINTRPDVICGCEGRRNVMLAWGHGGVDRLGFVTYKSARYCADYIGKSWQEEDKKLYRTISPPFHVMSKGIGREFCLRNGEQLKDLLSVTVEGVPVGLPRYYAHKLGIKAVDYLYEEVRDIPKSKERRSFVGVIPADVIALEVPRLQRKLNDEARTRLYKKGKV